MDIVLIHGACHGAWAWDFVKPQFKKLGYNIHTPTLTGMGEKVDLLSPAVTALTHVNDIVEYVEKGDLENVILIGHSYAGGPMTHAHSLLENKVRQLI